MENIENIEIELGQEASDDYVFDDYAFIDDFVFDDYAFIDDSDVDSDSDDDSDDSEDDMNPYDEWYEYYEKNNVLHTPYTDEIMGYDLLSQKKRVGTRILVK